MHQGKRGVESLLFREGTLDPLLYYHGGLKEKIQETIDFGSTLVLELFCLNHRLMYRLVTEPVGIDTPK